MKKLNHFRRAVLSVVIIILAANGWCDITPVLLIAPIGLFLLITNKTTFTIEE